MNFQSNTCPDNNWESQMHILRNWCYLIPNTEFVNVTPSTEQCYPITLQNFAALVFNNSTPRQDQIYEILLSEQITASTNHKSHKKTVVDGVNGLTHFLPICSAILKDGVTWCYTIRFPTVEYVNQIFPIYFILRLQLLQKMPRILRCYNC